MKNTRKETVVYSAGKRHINHSLVLAQPRKTVPTQLKKLFIGRKESNQINKIVRGKYLVAIMMSD